MLILNRVCHENVTDYRNYSLIWHTCLGNPELTLTWLRNYGSKNQMNVNFEALRASRISWLQKLQPKMKQSVWISCSVTDPTTELRVEKSNVCWFWTGSAMQMLLTTETTALFDTHALKFWTYSNLTTELRVEKSNVCWFWTGCAMQMLRTTGTRALYDTHALEILNSHLPDYGPNLASPWEF